MATKFEVSLKREAVYDPLVSCAAVPESVQSVWSADWVPVYSGSPDTHAGLVCEALLCIQNMSSAVSPSAVKLKVSPTATATFTGCVSNAASDPTTIELHV